MPGRKTLLFFIAVVVSIFIMTYQSKKGQTVSGGFMNNIFNASHSAATSVLSVLKSPFRKIALRDEENISLKKKVNELLIERDRFREAAIENNRLRELLQLREKHSDFISAARVIARGIDHWSNTMVIDKGIKDGVMKDMSAITPLGLAGKLLYSTDSYAGLLLLTNANFSVAVRLQESRREGVLSGTGAGTCVLKYVPYEEQVKPGDAVITSGLDALFPPGIPVGYISRVDRKGKGGKFQYIEVVPYQDDSRLEEVLIVR